MSPRGLFDESDAKERLEHPTPALWMTEVDRQAQGTYWLGGAVATVRFLRGAKLEEVCCPECEGRTGFRVVGGKFEACVICCGAGTMRADCDLRGLKSRLRLNTESDE